MNMFDRNQKNTRKFNNKNNQDTLLGNSVENGNKQDLSRSSAANIQPKLNIGKQNDPYEKEADNIANQVMRMPDNEKELQTKSLSSDISPVVQKQNDEDEEFSIQTKIDIKEQTVQPKMILKQKDDEEEQIQTKLMRKEEDNEESRLQAKTENGIHDDQNTLNDQSWLESKLNNTKNSGENLPEDTRAFMENRFGADFSNVKIHHDSSSDEMNKSLKSQAFTTGNDIYFNKGKYNTGSLKGKQLLAHELTHVVQQNKQNSSQNLQREPDNEEPKKIGNITVTYDSEPRFVQSAISRFNSGGLIAGDIIDRVEKKDLISVGLSNNTFIVGPFTSDMGNFVYVYNLGSEGGNASESLTKGTLLFGWKEFQTSKDIEDNFNTIITKYQSPGQTQQTKGQTGSKGTVDQGGKADVTNLEQDMRDILINWKEAAKDGIGDFMDDELLKLIADLNSGDMAKFMLALLGNTIWAAAAFATGGTAAFAISMAGIAVGSIPSIPTKAKPETLLTDVKKICRDNYINPIYDTINGQLRGKAAALIAAYPNINRYPALAKFVQASFRPELYNKILLTYQSPPTLNKAKIAERFCQVAKHLLKYFKSFQNSKSSTFRGRYFINNESHAAFIGSGTNRKLAVIGYHANGVKWEESENKYPSKFQPRESVTKRRYYDKGVNISYVEEEITETVLKMHRDRWGTEPRVFKDEEAARNSWL